MSKYLEYHMVCLHQCKTPHHQSSHDKRSENIFDIILRRISRKNIISEVSFYGDKITFEEYLRKENLSENTITSYLWTVSYFNANYDVVSKENLLAYKGYLMEFFKPKTVNLRIQAINKYLEYLEEQHLQLKAVKVQQKTS